MSGRHRKAFSNLQSCLTDSSSILLILLINLIQYKFEKARVKVNTDISDLAIWGGGLNHTWRFEGKSDKDDLPPSNCQVRFTTQIAKKI